MIASYQEMYMNTDNIEFIVSKRLEMVRHAYDNGIKKAAKFYNCSKNTIKKWCRRYSTRGRDGLVDLSRKPHNSPKRIKQEDIDLITTISKDSKEKGKCITVKNIRRKTKIENYADETINRYINKATKNKRNKKKKKSNGGSVLWKQDLLPFQLIQVDIKYLTDIDNLKPYFKGRNLMKYQITARDVATGFPIVAYCSEKSSTYTQMFIKQILYPFLKQFKNHHLDLKKIKIQTDCGPEFTSKYKKTKGESPEEHLFTVFVESKFYKHKTNIPGHCTANSDVETFHWSIEKDCLGWDDITNNEELIKYTTDYIERYINTKIETRGYSPMEKIKTALDVTNITFPKPQLLTV